MNTLRTTTFALTSLLVASQALADVKTHQDAKVQFWLPDGWSVEKEANAMTAQDPSGDVGLVFMIVDARDLDAAVDAIDTLMAFMVQDLEIVGKPVEATINGMKAVAIDAEGAVQGDDGQPVDVVIGAVIVMTPAGKPMIVLGFCDAGRFKRHEATLDKIFQSMKPLSKGF
jgi:predicted Zn-dependent protease